MARRCAGGGGGGAAASDAPPPTACACLIQSRSRPAGSRARRGAHPRSRSERSIDGLPLMCSFLHVVLSSRGAARPHVWAFDEAWDTMEARVGATEAMLAATTAARVDAHSSIGALETAVVAMQDAYASGYAAGAGDVPEAEALLEKTAQARGGGGGSERGGRAVARAGKGGGRWARGGRRAGAGGRRARRSVRSSWWFGRTRCSPPLFPLESSSPHAASPASLLIAPRILRISLLSPIIAPAPAPALPPRRLFSSASSCSCSCTPLRRLFRVVSSSALSCSCSCPPAVSSPPRLLFLSFLSSSPPPPPLQVLNRLAAKKRSQRPRDAHAIEDDVVARIERIEFEDAPLLGVFCACYCNGDKVGGRWTHTHASSSSSRESGARAPPTTRPCRRRPSPFARRPTAIRCPSPRRTLGRRCAWPRRQQRRRRGWTWRPGAGGGGSKRVKGTRPARHGKRIICTHRRRQRCRGDARFPSPPPPPFPGFVCESRARTTSLSVRRRVTRRRRPRWRGTATMSA